MTIHARLRWIERFKDLNFAQEWERARRPGKEMRKKIKRQCPLHAKKMSRDNVEQVYLVSEGGVVFVYDPKDNTVITVFPYSRERKK